MKGSREMKVKILVTLIAAVLCVSLLAGCQDSDSTNDETVTMSPTTTGSVSGNETAQPTVPSQDETELKGPGQEEPLEFSILLNAIMWTKNNLDINESEELKAWEEYSNTRITFITPPSSEYEDKLSIMTAGGDLPDVIVSGSSDKFDVNDLIDADAITPLDDLFDQYGGTFISMFEDKGFDYCEVMGSFTAFPFTRPTMRK